MENNLNLLLDRIINLENKFNEYEKRNNELMNSYYEYFQTIFLDYELFPKDFLKSRRLLYDEMLLFVDNVCDKYGLEYWLNYGTLLGAFRHKGFIPWDDDVDISMMRNDFNIFVEKFDHEIKDKNLSDCLRISQGYKVNENVIVTFPSIQCVIPKNITNIPLYHIAFIDLFAYDYIKSLELCNEKRYNDVRHEFNHNVLLQYNDSFTFDRNELIAKVYNDLGLTYDKSEYIVPGVDGVHAYGAIFPFMYFNHDDIFPLKKLTFEKNSFYCPHNEKIILKYFYGNNYMSIPKLIKHHNAMKNIKKYPTLIEIMKLQSNRLHEANNSF